MDLQEKEFEKMQKKLTKAWQLLEEACEAARNLRKQLPEGSELRKELGNLEHIGIAKVKILAVVGTFEEAKSKDEAKDVHSKIIDYVEK